jgi:hypothetical protein
MDSNFYKIHIYKIWSPLGNRIYIGSTEQPLSHRYSCHVCDYLNKKNKCSSHLIFMMYGVENCQISLIESHIVDSKLAQRKIERLYYEFHRLECVNKNRPYTSEEEKKEQIKKLGKEWYEKNQLYKRHRSLSNYYKKRDEKTTCETCGKEVPKITLKVHQNSLKCKNHSKNLPPLYIDLGEYEFNQSIQ